MSHQSWAASSSASSDFSDFITVAPTKSVCFLPARAITAGDSDEFRKSSQSHVEVASNWRRTYARKSVSSPCEHVALSPKKQMKKKAYFSGLVRCFRPRGSADKSPMAKHDAKTVGSSSKFSLTLCFKEFAAPTEMVVAEHSDDDFDEEELQSSIDSDEEDAMIKDQLLRFLSHGQKSEGSVASKSDDTVAKQTNTVALDGLTNVPVDLYMSLLEAGDRARARGCHFTARRNSNSRRRKSHLLITPLFSVAESKAASHS